MDNFDAERRGAPNFREQNPLHAPYCALSKIISAYAPPVAERCVAVGRREGDDLLCPIGSRFFGPWRFDFYEGPGGHVRGETVIVCEKLHLVFSGDLYVNIKGYSPEQQEFNRLAPFLMTGVGLRSGAGPAPAATCWWKNTPLPLLPRPRPVQRVG